jgi:hypothetical protein
MPNLKKSVIAIPGGEKQSRISADNGIVHPMLRSPRRPGGLFAMKKGFYLRRTYLSQLGNWCALPDSFA